MRTCSTCDFSVAIEGDPDGTLECHRYAIAAVGLDEDGEVVCAFPGCSPHMWCGDWAHTNYFSYSTEYSMREDG